MLVYYSKKQIMGLNFKISGNSNKLINKRINKEFDEFFSSSTWQIVLLNCNFIWQSKTYVTSNDTLYLTLLVTSDKSDPDVRAFTAVELKSYNAILAPPIYQKSLTAVEVKQ